MSGSYPIKHVFVLMLENRSFDHMFGFSGLEGTTPDGKQTKINGLDELNPPSNKDHSGKTYKAMKGASNTMPIDPGHEFIDVLQQQCGEEAAKNYKPGHYPDYSQYNMGGFVTDYENAQKKASTDLENIMRCYETKTQLPVIYELAKNFAICDNWFSSLPGPTWPNRFFVHGGSSSGMDDTPGNPQIIGWMLTGFRFPHGSIFDALKGKWAVYQGKKGKVNHEFSTVAMAGALAGVHLWDIKKGEDFAKDVQDPNYKPAYTFIEPNYGSVFSGLYQDGSSQHPLDSVIGGEKLIKETYDALRKSPIWESSCLIVTYDEHGGFYDHVTPGPAPQANDTVLLNGHVNQHGFKFDRYGIRVPAIVASPYTKAGTIDHTLYDHTSIPATLREIFGIKKSLSNREAQATTLRKLFPLTTPRTDCPKTLPEPASESAFVSVDHAYIEEKKVQLENAKVNKLSGNSLAVLQIAMKQKFERKYNRAAQDGDTITITGKDNKPVEIKAQIHSAATAPAPHSNIISAKVQPLLMKAEALFDTHVLHNEPSIGISFDDMNKLHDMAQTREDADKLLLSLLEDKDSIYRLLEEN